MVIRLSRPDNRRYDDMVQEWFNGKPVLLNNNLIEDDSTNNNFYTVDVSYKDEDYIFGHGPRYFGK